MKRDIALQPSAQKEPAIEVLPAHNDVAPMGQLISELIDIWKHPDTYSRLVEAFEPLREEGQPNPFVAVSTWLKPRIEPFAELGGIFKELLPDLLPRPVSKSAGFGYFLEASRDVQRITEELRKSFEEARKNTISPELVARLEEQQKIITKMEVLGYTPHDVLWSYVEKAEVPSEKVGVYAEKFAQHLWPEIKSSLVLDEKACLNDPRLTEKYRQMLIGHDAGHYENVISASVSTIERAVYLAKKRTGSNKTTFYWLKQKLGQLSATDFSNGMSGLRVFVVITEHLFASCHDDADANALKYPSRNATAHGIGSELATNVTSMNAILLAHAVITAIPIVEKYEKEVQALPIKRVA